MAALCYTEAKKLYTRGGNPMDELMQRALEGMKKNGFEVVEVATAAEA